MLEVFGRCQGRCRCRFGWCLSLCRSTAKRNKFRPLPSCEFQPTVCRIQSIADSILRAARFFSQHNGIPQPDPVCLFSQLQHSSPTAAVCDFRLSGLGQARKYRYCTPKFALSYLLPPPSRTGTYLFQAMLRVWLGSLMD